MWYHIQNASQAALENPHASTKTFIPTYTSMVQ